MVHLWLHCATAAAAVGEQAACHHARPVGVVACVGVDRAPDIFQMVHRALTDGFGDDVEEGGALGCARI